MGKESTMQTAVIFSPILPNISPSLSHTGVSELDIVVISSYTDYYYLHIICRVRVSDTVSPSRLLAVQE